MTDLKISSDELVSNILESIENLKGQEVKVMDFVEIENAPFQYFVICNGTSTTHVNSIASAVERDCRNKLSERPYGVAGKQNAEWILMDYVTVVVHVFQPKVREFYDLEGFWGDAKTTPIASNF